MSEENTPAEKPHYAIPFAWVSMRHKSGVVVSLPVSSECYIPYDIFSANIDRMLEAGFIPDLPPEAAAEGEKIDEAGYCVITKHTNTSTSRPMRK